MQLLMLTLTMKTYGKVRSIHCVILQRMTVT